MTVTALFRDFLIINKAKQKYEHCFSGFFGAEINLRLGWQNNRLWKYISAKVINEYGEYYYRQLGYVCLTGKGCSHSTFSWLNTHEGFDFWNDLTDRWVDYLNEHRHKLNI